ncbi:MAG: glycosyltransferase family 2 protein [Rickettsiaceae bacterium]|nr:glycosyltransferase family 2 protein [Rickettsiaceae bacterium]
MDNEEIIDLLVDEYDLPNIDLSTASTKALNFQKLNEYYTKGYIHFEKNGGEKCYAINNILLLKDSAIDPLDDKPIYLIRNNDLLQILERDFALQNTHNAISHLEEIPPNVSAKSIDYFKAISGFGIIFFSTFFLFFQAFNVLNALCFMMLNLLKFMLFQRVLVNEEESSPLKLIDQKLPIYSILIPLYKEELKVSSILQSMENINYPKNKMDVKLIIESDDTLTSQALAAIDLPSYVHIIRVPYSLPRTKPKALNYAMAYVKGEFLTIYDAEDEPDPDQLLKAIYAFDNLPENFVCIQAKLNFYNAKDNLLTRFFSIEYSIWFEYLLKGLSLLDWPVTLGGTSNHFKVDKLKEVGCWDAYNVTEDADLGIRLYLKGYKVHLINSTTIEESPSNINVWIAQRSRWIKGFIQTLYVFIKTPKNLQKFSLSKICVVYIFVGLSTYSLFILPWVLLSVTMNTDILITYLWIVATISSFAYMYSSAALALTKNNTTLITLSPMDWVTLICWPLYFILHTIASYRAIYEILISPFTWNKTPHGKFSDDLDE